MEHGLAVYVYSKPVFHYIPGRRMEPKQGEAESQLGSALRSSKPEDHGGWGVRHAGVPGGGFLRPRRVTE